MFLNWKWLGDGADLFSAFVMTIVVVVEVVETVSFYPLVYLLKYWKQ